MRRSRTPQPPLFELMRPHGHLWTWEVSYHVASSGYVTGAHVTALRYKAGDDLIGTASCDVGHGDPLNEVLEMLATEAMLAACEVTLFEDVPHRSCTFVSGDL